MTVHLVGAGPGDPDLLTTRATRLLRHADVVIHDRLIDQRVLDLAPIWAERIDVGKRPGSPPTAQARINELLIDRGGRHDTVVRLKGGDPYVFGRGGEEALALQGAGIAVTVVPGITSAIAAPAAAGVPVTHRGLASGVTFVTGHQDPTQPTPIDWHALARSGTTLVVLMGVAQRARIADELMAGGLTPSTPVCVVSNATTDRQRIVRATLDDLGDLDVTNPATIVVGAVAALDTLAALGLPLDPHPHSAPAYSQGGLR